MDGAVKILVELGILIGGFVAMVWVMRDRLGLLATRMQAIETELKPLSAQLTALTKDNQQVGRDLSKLELVVSRLGEHVDELASQAAVTDLTKRINSVSKRVHDYANVITAISTRLEMKDDKLRLAEFDPNDSSPDL